MNNCAILEEEDENEDSTPPSPVSSSVESQSNLNTPTTGDHSKHSVDFSKSSMKFNFSNDGLTNQTVVHRFPLPADDVSRCSSDAFEPISKASSMPVLYEEDEAAEE